MNRVVATIWSFMLIATGVAVVCRLCLLQRAAGNAAVTSKRLPAEILNSGVARQQHGHVAALKGYPRCCCRLVE